MIFSRSFKSRFFRRGYSSEIITYSLKYSEYGNPKDVVKLDPGSLNTNIKSNQIIVKMKSAVLHPSDVNTIQGKYPIKPTLPAIVGNEGYAEIIKVGENVKLEIGDHIVPVISNSGTCTTYKIYSESDVIKVPKVDDFAVGAIMTVNPGTAYRMMKDFVNLNENDWMLQTGGTSAVGIYAIQLAKKWNIKTLSIIRARDSEKETEEVKSILYKYGADKVVTETEAREVSKGVSAKLALNCVGGRGILSLLSGLASSGVVVTYGGMNSLPMTVPVSSLIFKDVQLRGYWASRWVQDNCRNEAHQEMLQELAKGFQEGWLKPSPYEIFDFKNQWKEAIDSSNFKNDKPQAISKKSILLMN